MREASGFPCPVCKQDFRAEVRDASSVRLLELRCHNCEPVTDWAVEMGHGGGWLDPKGEVRDRG